VEIVAGQTSEVRLKLAQATAPRASPVDEAVGAVKKILKVRSWPAMLGRCGRSRIRAARRGPWKPSAGCSPSKRSSSWAPLTACLGAPASPFLEQGAGYFRLTGLFVGGLGMLYVVSGG